MSRVTCLSLLKSFRLGYAGCRVRTVKHARADGRRGLRAAAWFVLTSGDCNRRAVR